MKRRRFVAVDIAGSLAAARDLLLFEPFWRNWRSERSTFQQPLVNGDMTVRVMTVVLISCEPTIKTRAGLVRPASSCVVDDFSNLFSWVKLRIP